MVTLADRADDKALREQIRLFVLNAQLNGELGADADFALRCLAELRSARVLGVLDGAADPAALANRLGDLAHFSDPAAVVREQWALADEIAVELRARGFGTLAALLTLRPVGDANADPLLAVTVRYYFRRAVEEDPRLFQGFAFSQLEVISRTQENAATALAGVAARLDALHETLRDQELPFADEVVDVPEPSVADRFREQTNGVVAASPDGTRVLGGSKYDGKLRLFDARTGKELRRLAGHTGWVVCVAFSPDGAKALSGGADGSVKMWEVATGKLVRAWPPKRGAPPVAIGFTADGRPRLA
ncbi:hypothetical protein R5W23_004031 [Gemmata sp. JC673]|uniref:WD40 repeat domain-containing protein n=1 Tax=Gemmata algarum TaxID=2975278 RepID=A0ABU5F5H7_9BACT|nr:hypothetical protein [Gemmata algarum]MDY3562565.1 hypothetical protein [Gemmata algarum]